MTVTLSKKLTLPGVGVPVPGAVVAIVAVKVTCWLGTDDAGLNSTVNSEIARIYQRLRANPEFRLLWADRIQKHFFNGGAQLYISNNVPAARFLAKAGFDLTGLDTHWGSNHDLVKEAVTLFWYAGLT